MINCIASVIGKPLYMDKATAQQRHLEFAKACVEIIFEEKVPSTKQVDSGRGHPIVINVEVP